MFAGLSKVNTSEDKTVLKGMCSKENEQVKFDSDI